MSGAAKELDRGMFVDVSDRLVNGTESARTRICADGIMTSHNIHINWFSVVNCIQKPLLSHQSRCFCDLRNVAVAGKVVQNSKGHDSKTLSSCEVPIWNTNVLEFSGRWIQNLDIACYVAVAIDFGKLSKGLIRDLAHIKLMV